MARAKRWGLESQATAADADPEAKLAARAKRFELPHAPGDEEPEAAKIAARAKRFERPSDMSELADKEKLAARAKRWEVNRDANDGIDL